MSPRPKLPLVVSLLACLLTLAASGDDVCVVRLVLVPESLGEIEQPLDDPNTDFLESQHTTNLQHCGWDAGCGMTRSQAEANAVRAAGFSPRPGPLAIDDNFSLAPLNIPLLC